MSYVRIWVHLVWATKRREPILTADVRRYLCLQIMQNCKEKGIYLRAINGYLDHLHCLISLGNGQTIAEVAQFIKGGSSHWINQNRIVNGGFDWQDDYFAVSVSESIVPAVVRYIHNQERHHASKSFDDEVNEFISKFGFVRING
ncbi:IS200/IS605 family transposase [Pinibacter aurantiacus]|uniref:IS200/IS605 family transposase n=1 Tax=Pinibacter aurantiacus TaxID=2851599 RepID=A0A9E2W4E5_9BACT|nr:IS200/IS605 family transposase [Pinibacter aurantiacus]MBV4359640.1 IS200/IS605 family transposase [Pinibacter aurantiacus]